MLFELTDSNYCNTIYIYIYLLFLATNRGLFEFLTQPVKTRLKIRMGNYNNLSGVGRTLKGKYKIKKIVNI